jgi:hypothetical protein
MDDPDYDVPAAAHALRAQASIAAVSPCRIGLSWTAFTASAKSWPVARHGHRTPAQVRVDQQPELLSPVAAQIAGQ